MENQIVTTPQEVINAILALCGAIITISAALTVIIKAIDKARQPNKRQDERIAALEENVQKIEDRLKLGNVRFQSDSDRMTQIETDVKEANKVIIEGLQALTAHAIDGNNTDNLYEAKRRLDDYLIGKL